MQKIVQFHKYIPNLNFLTTCIRKIVFLNIYFVFLPINNFYYKTDTKY